MIEIAKMVTARMDKVFLVNLRAFFIEGFFIETCFGMLSIKFSISLMFLMFFHLPLFTSDFFFVNGEVQSRTSPPCYYCINNSYLIILFF
jgi:hypothetical protein